MKGVILKLGRCCLIVKKIPRVHTAPWSTHHVETIH